MGKFFKEATPTPKVIHLPQNLRLENVLAKRKIHDIERLTNKADFLIRRSQHPLGKALSDTEQKTVERHLQNIIEKNFLPRGGPGK